MKIKYPFLPPGRKHLYVPEKNSYMQLAMNFAFFNSLDDYMPTCSVIVKNNQIIGIGANGSDYHKTHECRRKQLGIPTGQGYELCEGCHPRNHSEARAIADAVSKKNSTLSAELYLWGHWWCCEPCWQSIIKARIKKVYLMRGSEKLFNREAKGNIVGRQFAGIRTRFATAA
jgi:deoxycytidylate deaminase